MPGEIIINLPLPGGDKLLSHCRDLIASGEDPNATVIVKRGDTQAFTSTALSVFAGLATVENDNVSIRFAKYRPFGENFKNRA